MLNSKKVLEKLEISNWKELTSELLESKKGELSEEEYQFVKTKLETIPKGKELALELLENKKGELSKKGYQEAKNILENPNLDKTIDNILSYWEKISKSDAAFAEKVLNIFSEKEKDVRKEIIELIKNPSLSSEEKDKYINILLERENRDKKYIKYVFDVIVYEQNKKVIILGGIVVVAVIIGTGNLGPVIGAVGTAAKSTLRLVSRNPKGTLAFIKGLVA